MRLQYELKISLWNYRSPSHKLEKQAFLSFSKLEVWESTVIESRHHQLAVMNHHGFNPIISTLIIEVNWGHAYSRVM